MEASLSGVIPLNSTAVSFMSMSLCKLVAIGLQHSVYIFDTYTGENIARVNHYPHLATSAAWHPTELAVATGDSAGALVVSRLTTMTWEVYQIDTVRIQSLLFHTCGRIIFAITEKGFIVWDFDDGKVKKAFAEVRGFKILMDFFCPQKVMVVGSEEVSVVRWSEKAKALRKGKVEKAVDAVVNPGVINTILVLSENQLVEYDTVRHM